MGYRAQIDDHGQITRYKDTDTGEVISAREFERRIMSQQGGYSMGSAPGVPQMYAPPAGGSYGGYSSNVAPAFQGAQQQQGAQQLQGAPQQQAPQYEQSAAQPNYQQPGQMAGQQQQPQAYQQPGMPANPGQAQPEASPPQAAAAPASAGNSPLVQQGAQMLNGASPPSGAPAEASQAQGQQAKNLRMLGIPGHQSGSSVGYKTHGFLDATSIAILLPTLVLLALIIAAAHKKRLFPWQTIRTFNPPSGLMSPRDYERSFCCPPNLRRHGRMGKRNPEATWADADGIVIPFGFLARTHLPVTIPMGRLPNKNMFIVAPSGSGKTTLMRAIMKALLAKPCVMIAMEAKANDPNLDEKKESFKHTVLPEAKAAGFDTLYFNPLDIESIHWNPLDLDPSNFASSIVQDVNSLPPEEQHWAERDHGYINGLVKLLKWGAVMVVRDDENGQASEVQPLPCNPRGLMRLVNNRRNIVESLRRLKTNTEVDPGELTELTLILSSIIRTDTDWDKNIQGVRGRLRMFRNEGVLRCTEKSNIDLKTVMHKSTVLIFGAPASLGPDAESLAACFVYQLQQALHTRYGTASVLPLFAFFDEYQTLNIDLAGRLSAIVRGANGGLTVILQNISQIAKSTGGKDPTSGGASELKTLFSNCAIRVCLHNADDSTARFFSDEIGKHAVVVPGISDHYESNGFGIFPTSWNRIHSQQVVARVDADSIKRMEKHHALVYLSPAGDPEFGETKPFMVDLRGIEEIARLHLLHNVTARSPQPEEIDPPVDNILPGGINPALMPGMTSVAAAASAAAENLAPHAQAALSTSARIMPEPELPAAPPEIKPPFPFAGQSLPQRPQPPAFPAASLPTTSAALNSQPAAPQETANIQPEAANQEPTAPVDSAETVKLCHHCNKAAGKGRFCIECGKFVGQVSGTATVPQPTQQQTAPPTQQQTAPPAPTNRPAFPFANQQQNAPAAPGSAHRKTVTSLNADLAQILPGSENAPQGKPQAGVEF